MSAIRKKIWLYLTIFPLFLSGWMNPLPKSALPAVNADHVAVLLVLDNSGSMKTSDPGGLRFTGVRLFASLLAPGDSLGLILFSTQARLLTDGLVMLDTQADKRNILNDLIFQEADGYTDVKAALEQAREVLMRANLHNKKVVIVLLTDGKPEIESPYPGYEREALELAASLNIPIMTIALTSAAQTSFLDQLAAATGGEVLSAEGAPDLLNAFLQALGQIKDRTVIRGNEFGSSSSLEVDPALAPYLPSVSFVVGKPESATVRLFGPDGGEITAKSPGVSFADSSDARFLVLTLENPPGGTYSFRTTGNGSIQSWAILHSRLRVHISELQSIHPLGEALPIEVELLEETASGKFTKILGQAEFSAQITRPDGKVASLDQFYDDGSHGDAIAGDGSYTRLYPNADVAGEYIISIHGWKGAVPVQTDGRVRVMQFPVFVMDSPLDMVEVRDDKVKFHIHLEGGEPPVFDEGVVTARVISPSGQTQEVVLHGNGVYTGEFLAVEDGNYRVIFETRNAKYRGVDYQTRLKTSFMVAIIPFAEVSVVDIHIPSACFSRPEELNLLLAVAASRADTWRLSVPDGWQIVPEEVSVIQGEQTVNLLLLALNGLGDESQSVDLHIESSNRLEVQPDASLRVNIQRPGVWTRCRGPIRLGGSLLIFLMIATIAMGRICKARLSLLVTGTLRHWPMNGILAQAIDIDLTALRKPTVLVGSGADCDVILAGAGLASNHARLSTQKSPDGVEIYLEPIGETQKGYSLQTARFILRHGEVFKMGAHEFQYLSDHGE